MKIFPKGKLVPNFKYYKNLGKNVFSFSTLFLSRINFVKIGI